MEFEIGDVKSIDGVKMRYVGNGRFEPVQDVLAKRFDAGGPLSGQAVCD
jgi:hypothetical protein